MQTLLMPYTSGFLAALVLALSTVFIGIYWFRERFDGDLEDRPPFMKRWKMLLIANVALICIFLISFFNYALSKEVQMKATFGGIYDNEYYRRGSKHIENFVVLNAEDGKTYNVEVYKSDQTEIKNLNKEDKEKLVLIIRKSPLITFINGIKYKDKKIEAMN